MPVNIGVVQQHQENRHAANCIQLWNLLHDLDDRSALLQQTDSGPWIVSRIPLWFGQKREEFGRCALELRRGFQHSLNLDRLPSKWHEKLRPFWRTELK